MKRKVIKSNIVLTSILSLMLSFSNAYSQDNTILNTNNGAIKGIKLDDNSLVFRSIPFAKPPINELRFNAPKPMDNWQDIKDGTKSASGCTQLDYGWNKAIAEKSSEDCLYLELRTHDVTNKKPIMVFLHGGANRAGSGDGIVWSKLAENKDIVLVSVQYRLGAIGYLSHKELSKEQGQSGNYGLMDVVAALKWLNENANNFGGDKNNITVFGHSAGAQNTGLLLSIPSANGLFHKLILQSGTPQFGYRARSLQESEKMGAELIEKARKNGANGTDIEILRSLPAKELLSIGDSTNAPLNDKGFIWDQMTIDGKVLPKSPKDILLDGQSAKVPIILGVSSKEFGLYGSDDAFSETINTRFGKNKDAALKYYTKQNITRGTNSENLAGDLMFRCPVDFISQNHTKSGNNVFLYHLETDINNNVHHGSEWPYVFGKSENQNYFPPLSEYWVNFAKTNNPNSKNLFKWKPFANGKNYIAFTSKGPKMLRNISNGICNKLLEVNP